jgi:hypothetical protein
VLVQGLHAIFERFRGVLHEGEIDKRVQYMIEGLFAVRKTNFADFPALESELDLVEADDQITHEISLDDQIDPGDAALPNCVCNPFSRKTKMCRHTPMPRSTAVLTNMHVMTCKNWMIACDTRPHTVQLC